MAARRLVHDLPADDGVEHLRIQQLRGVVVPRLDQMGVEHGDVGQLADRQSSFDVFFKAGPRRVLGLAGC